MCLGWSEEADSFLVFFVAVIVVVFFSFFFLFFFYCRFFFFLFCRSFLRRVSSSSAFPRSECNVIPSRADAATRGWREILYRLSNIYF